ncbi:MAG TPA: ComF family protein [Pyrinomonadaceae bacterium]
MHLTSAASLCYDSLLTVVYPRRCAVCGGSVESRALGGACARCWQQTRIFSTETLCWKCGEPSAAVVATEKREAVRCRRCEDASFTAARACGAYEGALRASILLLKREPHVCRKLREGLVKAQQWAPLNVATQIIPVPLHGEREQERGFNQATLIAGALSKATALPLNTVSLVRVKNVRKHRAGMDVKGRRDTVAGAFRVVHPAVVAGERVLLIDDVFTTGATASACADVLLKAGAAEVFVLTIARAVRY